MESSAEFLGNLSILSSTGLVNSVFGLLENTSDWLGAAFDLAGLL